jgi:hypothetical protein
MYVVELTISGHAPDYKAFGSVEGARKRISGALRLMPDDISEAVVYQVPNETSADLAIQALKEGRALIVERDQRKLVDVRAGD